ncbi:alkaline phosphatase family protein [Jiella pelagia]|uniref:Alkaline phosphatase family protein n=1 Tax=Jiella pelagia TaxID=2986949 RepID=A0ABY7BYY4_9HYPH|nr:alkaline phosphatase family protein [Jiella pelagia]WAP67738.1 alkaline phosphatase family protein [Jiella pelagia]
MSAGSTLLVCFDGLRRDRATAERMPNLSRFMAAGADLIKSRSVFPSETRVASTTTVTGCTPGEHGLVANQFINRAVAADGLFNTANHRNLARADELGVLLDRQSLGQRLAAAGKRFAVVTTATAGATYMMSYGAEKHGQPVFSVHPGVGTPTLMKTAEERLGPVPAAATPNTAQIDYATRVLTDIVYPEHRPDLAILWMSDPDITSHGFGIDAPETIAAQRGCDEAFGRILDWQSSGEGPENIVVMSDHGHVTGAARFDLAAALPEHAGQLSPGYFSGLYLAEPTRKAITAAVERLTHEPWCGLVFVNIPGDPQACVPGALPASALGGGHRRSAPVCFTLRAAESPNRARPRGVSSPVRFHPVAACMAGSPAANSPPFSPEKVRPSETASGRRRPAGCRTSRRRSLPSSASAPTAPAAGCCERCFPGMTTRPLSSPVAA